MDLHPDAQRIIVLITQCNVCVGTESTNSDSAISPRNQVDILQTLKL